VQSGVGSTLREARKRRKIELSEVETATKIRVGFLRAIEDEDWKALPGEAYARGFVRTYAGFLGLDGSRLASQVPAWPAPPVVAGAGRRRPSRRAAVALVCIALVAVIAAVGLLWSGGGSDGPASPSAGGGTGGGGPEGASEPGGAPSGVPSVRQTSKRNSDAVVLSLRTTAELWVCLLDEDGKPLVDGVVLPAGAEEGPFRSGSFTVSFGNGEVEMRIDGRESDIPESASPLGYEIGRDRSLAELGESERPTCT
jgi:cytoskeleton protein RodZ